MANLVTTHQADSPIKPYQDSARNNSHWQVGSLFLALFMFAQFFSLTRNFFIYSYGAEVRGLATIASFGSIVLLPIILFCYHTVSVEGAKKSTLKDSAQLWLMILFISVVVLTAYGFFQGYAVSDILADTSVYLIFIAFVILGSIHKLWQSIFTILLVITVMGFVVNLLGLQNINLLLENNTSDRIARDLLAYKSRAAIDIWPILLLTIYIWKSRGVAMLIFTMAFFALILQILFQKRLPVAEVIAFYFIFFLSISRNRKQQITSSQGKMGKGLKLNLVLILIPLGIITILFLGPSFEGQLTGLVNRYSIGDESRIGEAVAMVTSLQDWEVLTGRGMGGYFEYTDKSGYVWGSYIDNAKVIGKTTLHVGILMPMLKGGVYLMIVFYAGFILVFQKLSLYTFDYFSFAAIAYVTVKLFVFLQGGFLIMASVFDVILVGLCLGHLLAENTVKLQNIIKGTTK